MARSGLVFSLSFVVGLTLFTPALRAEEPVSEEKGDVPKAPGAANAPNAPNAPGGASVPKGEAPPTDPMLLPVPPAEKIIATWQEALAIVRARSVDLVQAHAQIEASRGRARMTLASSLPRLTGTGTLTHQMIMPTPDPTTSGITNFFPGTVLTGALQLQVPLFSARNWYDYGTERENIRKTELDAVELERRIVAALAEAIVAVYTAERLAEVSRVSLSSSLTTLDLNKKRERLGSATSIDVLRLEQEVTRARAQVVSADEILRKARESLGMALGEPVAYGVPQNISLNQLWLDAQNTCKGSESIENRPDVKAAQANVSLTERKKKAVAYSFLPTLLAQSTLTASTNDFSTGSRGPVGWSIGGVLSWNLYEGGLRYGEQRQNAALFEVAKAQADGVFKQATMQVQQTVRAVEVAVQSLALSTSAKSTASESLRLTKLKYESGGASSFELVDAEKVSREADLDVTVKEFELLRAKVVAYLALSTCTL